MLTGKTCNTYPDGNGDNSKNCLPELAEYLNKTDLDGDDSNGKQRVLTYTIGFATDQDLLEDTAKKGGGKYYTANTTQELTRIFPGGHP